MRPTIFEIIQHALSVGNWLQNTLFYCLLLAMTHIVMFQSRLSVFRLRSGIADNEIE